MTAVEESRGPSTAVEPAVEPLLAKETPTPAAVIHALADAGVDLILGIPGGYTGALFEALHGHPTIRVVQVREEAVGAIAAEAAGRLRGRPVAVMGQGEWIVGNAGQGLLEAVLGSSPVLALTEMSDGGALSHHGYYQSGGGDYGSWDAVSALRAVTKRTFVAGEPVQSVQMTQLAVKHAMSGNPGPVAVVYHSRGLKGSVGPDTHPRLYSSRHYAALDVQPDPVSIELTANMLQSARRPVIVAGNGVRVGQACDELVRVAEAIGADVATTAAGKGVYPETDSRSLGVMGTFGTPEANAAVARADVILAVGTRLAPIDTGDESPDLIDPLRQTLIQIDVEPLNASWTYPVHRTVVGSAASALKALLCAFGDHPQPEEDRVTNHGAQPVRATAAAEVHEERARSDAFPFHPQRIIRVLQEEWPQDGVITSDAGENRLFMLHWFRTSRPGSYLMPAAGGGMGYAMPAALGAKLVDPDPPTIAVVGDGGFAVSMSTLMTAAQEGVPVVVLVLNNAALGWVAHGMGEKAVASHFMDFDHARIARSMGCEGLRPDNVDELRAALRRARETTVPLVIDARTNMETSFRDIVQPISGKRWKAGE